MDLYKIQKEVEEEFITKKSRADNLANKNFALASKNPAFLKLNALQKELNLEIAKLEASGKDATALKTTLKELVCEKQKYLKSIGLEESDLFPKYECKICGDTGKVAGGFCECFIREKNKAIIRECGLKLDEIPDFSELQTDIFKDEKQKNKFIELEKYLEKWCDAFPNVTKQRIVICGETGLGKTTLARCMAKRLSLKGHLVCFLTAFEVNNILLRYHTNFKQNKTDELSSLLESDILFVDDLGTEPILKNVTTEYLQLVLSERERKNRPIIITTNLDERSLAERYGERISSRIFDKKSSTCYCLTGNDLRK